MSEWADVQKSVTACVDAVLTSATSSIEIGAHADPLIPILAVASFAAAVVWLLSLPTNNYSWAHGVMTLITPAGQQAG